MTKKTDARATLLAALAAYVQETYGATLTDLVDAWDNRRSYWCKESDGPRWTAPRLPDGREAPPRTEEYVSVYDNLQRNHLNV